MKSSLAFYCTFARETTSLAMAVQVQALIARWRPLISGSAFLAFISFNKNLTSYNTIGEKNKVALFVGFKMQNNHMQKSGKKHGKPLDLFHRFSLLSTLSPPAQFCFSHTLKAKNNYVEIPKLVQSHKQEEALKYRGLAKHNEKPQRRKVILEMRGKTNTKTKWLQQLYHFEFQCLPQLWKR